MPPPLSRAIGLEIKKCIMGRMKEEKASGESSDWIPLLFTVNTWIFKQLSIVNFPFTENLKQEKMEVSD